MEVTIAPGARADETGCMRVPRPLPIAAFACAALVACGVEPGTPVELCTALLASKVPGSEVVATLSQPPDGLELTYVVPAGDEATREGRLACEVERSRLGGPRLRAAVLDGRPLSDTELVVRNSNLLLDELYAIGSGRG